MASAVDICNLALSHLGDSATISRIDPPEGSAQAEHCQRFYPLARNSLFEMHNWGFATKRASMALIGTNTIPQWAYTYVQPIDAVNLLAVYAQYAPDDYSEPFPMAYTQSGVTNTGQGLYTPQPFSSESLNDGTAVIYTNVENAILRYTGIVTDSSKYSPLFCDCLSWLLASYLAGAIIKGDAGAAEAKRCYQMFQVGYTRATVSDANQRRTTIQMSTPWMAGR